MLIRGLKVKFAKYYQGYKEMNWRIDAAERNFQALAGSTKSYYHKIGLSDGRSVYMVDEGIFQKLQTVTDYLIQFEDEMRWK